MSVSGAMYTGVAIGDAAAVDIESTLLGDNINKHITIANERLVDNIMISFFITNSL
jgi:hypothetical protein